SASSVAAPPSISRNRLRQIRERFLAGLPWKQRAAVKDLPGAVVLGPAGSGKSKLIDLDVDWQRQARQFLPSYTSDSLLQIYLGPDTVVQELSAPLLEDDTPQAGLALRRLWKETFGQQQQALAVLVLDARWLAETPPDEVRRTAQLLRGKLNLLAEVRHGQVETRLCLTRMDELEGFEDFANLLQSHRVPLSFELPPRGEEGKLASLLQAQERYLALGLTSLPVESFERLERFYSQGHRPFEALARFVTALLEGGTLAFAPRLSRVYLSSLLPTARAAGVLSVSAEANDVQAVRQRYLRTHLKRAAIAAAACCVPLLAAYAHFSWRLSQTQERVKRFEDTVQRMRDQGQEVSGTVVQDQVLAAGQSMDVLWRAMSYWPLLPYSFIDEREGLRLRLARGIREAHLRPALERCHKQPGACRPEQVVYMMAALHASRDEGLGQFVLSSLRSRSSWSFVQTAEAATTLEEGSLDAKRSWVSTVNLLDSLVSDYIQISDKPWQAPTTTEASWAHWPFREPLTLEAQLEPWQAHFKRLQELLHDQNLEPYELERLDAELESMQEERRRLHAQLEDSALLSTLPRVVDLLAASEARVDMSRFKGLPSTVKAVEWMNRNREVLASILRLEEEAYLGVKAVQKMTVAELLVRDGLWLQGPDNNTFHVTVLQSTFDFRPRDSARQLHQALLRYHEKTGRMPFGGTGDEAEQRAAVSANVSAARVEFDTRLRPLVDEFTQRLKSAGLPLEQASQRQEHVQRKVNQFAIQYRQRLFQRVANYQFNAPLPAMAAEELSRLTQPSSELVDMLRDVAHGASLEPLEGPYYEPLRNAVAPFKPIAQVMKPDESGNYAALLPYRSLVAQLATELNAIPKASTAAEPGKEAAGAAQLTEMLTPLGRVALSMLLEQEGSYLHKVDAWLDQQGIIGELREPFRQPFLVVRELGQQEIEQKLAKQWEEAWGRMLRPLLTRYPFAPEATQEVDAGDLQVLRRQDGAFWDFVNRVLTPVCEERGAEWVPRGALKDRLTLPSDMLTTLGGLSRLSRLLWDAQGQPRPLMLQVMPLPLPAAPTPGSFVTLGSLKCGKTTVLAYNQSPSWQEFPLSWWDQQTASLMLELRSPEQQTTQYTSLEKSRSTWGCFRLLEASAPTGDHHRQWSLRGRNAKEGSGTVEIRFGLKGEPWVPFREVPR
ncbi:MAG TPA: type VI secretion IcmF C-terminal domain-containing protein, partial [Myxococcaceae bacterium]